VCKKLSAKKGLKLTREEGDQAVRAARRSQRSQRNLIYFCKSIDVCKNIDSCQFAGFQRRPVVRSFDCLNSLDCLNYRNCLDCLNRGGGPVVRRVEAGVVLTRRPVHLVTESIGKSQPIDVHLTVLTVLTVLIIVTVLTVLTDCLNSFDCIDYRNCLDFLNRGKRPVVRRVEAGVMLERRPVQFVENRCSARLLTRTGA